MTIFKRGPLEIITRKKVTYKTQEIIAKCLKQFDLRLFEEIGGNIQEKKEKTGLEEEKKKSTLRIIH